MCTNSTLGKQAKDLYLEWLRNRVNIKDCPYPCAYLKIRSIGSASAKNLDTGNFGFVFNMFTEKAEAHFTYTELELIAEFGGYVGLFLGYSVLSLTDIFNKSLEYYFKAL